MSQHGNAMRHANHFSEFVADENDGQTLRNHLREGVEQGFAFLRREHGGGLIQNQDARAAIQRLQNFHALAFAHTQARHLGIGIDHQSKLLRHRHQLLARSGAVRDGRPQRLGAEQHVVEHGEVVGEREVLVHHADARRQCRARIARWQHFAMHADAALVGHVVTEKNRHQRRFARAVLAQKREHLARAKRERDVVIGRQRPEALGDVAEFKNRRWTVVCAGRCCCRHQGLGCASLTFTVNLPARISACLSATFFFRSAGTLASNVPSGASDEPLCFIIE